MGSSALVLAHLLSRRLFISSGIHVEKIWRLRPLWCRRASAYCRVSCSWICSPYSWRCTSFRPPWHVPSNSRDSHGERNWRSCPLVLRRSFIVPGRSSGALLHLLSCLVRAARSKASPGLPSSYSPARVLRRILLHGSLGNARAQLGAQCMHGDDRRTVVPHGGPCLQLNLIKA